MAVFFNKLSEYSKADDTDIDWSDDDDVINSLKEWKFSHYQENFARTILNFNEYFNLNFLSFMKQ